MSFLAAALTTHGGASDKGSSQYFADTIITAGVSLAVAIMGAGYHRITSSIKRQETFYEDFQELQELVVGKKANDIDQHPPPGLASIVKQQVELQRDNARMLREHSRVLDRVDRGTRALVAENVENGGSTKADQLNRIEKILTDGET